MKNKVTVSRAPRFRKRIYTQLNAGDYYLADILDSSTDEYGIFPRGEDSVCPYFTLPYKVVLEKDEVVPFDSFDDMCKWVANGKRLEDLPSDDGQCLFSDLEFGELFLIFNGCGAIGMKTDDCKFVEVGTCGGATEHPSNSTTIVTRLNIGDTIEITE